MFSALFMAGALLWFAPDAHADSLTKVTKGVPAGLQVWGYTKPTDANEVAGDATKLAKDNLSGEGTRVILMSGTHGFCGEHAGKVADAEITFAEEDTLLHGKLKTKDGKAVTTQAWPINPENESPKTVKDAERLTKFKDDALKAIADHAKEKKEEAKILVILAYCCSAG
jgi:hypothetical protein